MNDRAGVTHLSAWREAHRPKAVVDPDAFPSWIVSGFLMAYSLVAVKVDRRHPGFWIAWWRGRIVRVGNTFLVRR